MHRHLPLRDRSRAALVALAAVVVAAVVLPAAAPAAHGQPPRVERGEGEVTLVVGYEDGTTRAEQADIVARTDVADLEREDLAGIDADIVTAPTPDVGEAVAALRADPRVAYVEESIAATPAVVERVPTDPLWSEMATHEISRLPEAWARSTGSQAVTIAVIDNGFDVTHPDLRGRLAVGRDVVDGGTNVAGDVGCEIGGYLPCRDRADAPAHGTRSALMVGAAANNELGTAGVCWSCTVLPVKAADALGFMRDYLVAQGIDHAVARGAEVISLSLTFPEDPKSPGQPAVIAEEIDAARDAGVLVVASAGNAGGTTNATVKAWPAADPDVLGVAGTRSDSPDRVNLLADGSSYGGWVSVAAPYEHLVSTRSGAPMTFRGTSSSAPVGASTPGLMKPVAPTMTAEELRSVLEDTAQRVQRIEHGRVDAAAALEAVMGAAYTSTVVPAAPTHATAGSGFADGEVDVSWRHGDGFAADSFTVTAQPGDHTVTVGPSAHGTTLRGLGADAPYTVTITAENDAGLSQPVTAEPDPVWPGGSEQTSLPPPPEDGCTCIAEQPDPPEQDVPTPSSRRAVYGDWDGDGVDTPGWFIDGRWYLRTTLDDGGADIVTLYGQQPGDVPVVGDWDGDGQDGIGVRRGTTMHLRDEPGPGGGTSHQFTFGIAGDRPVAGDWDHDGRDTVALVRGKTWYLRHTSSPGVRTYDTTALGVPGDVPVAGDWEGDGRDTPGVFRKGLWYRLVQTDRSAVPAGQPQLHPTVGYGASPGDQPAVGAQRPGGLDALVIARGSTWHLRDEEDGSTWKRIEF